MMEATVAQWVGRTETMQDIATASPLAGLSTALDHPVPLRPPEVVPPLGHWMYFLPRTRQSDIGDDGHPRRGGFLPPVNLPRRMWAAGDVWFHRAIPVNVPVTRRSSILDVARKDGKSGRLVFVKVAHEITTPGGVAVTETQDIVYREASSTGAADATAPPPAAPAWERVVTPDSVLLFRYSALTFNAHRIHYDREYARHEEGYPGLVVHGPLTATLLMDLFLRYNPDTRVTRFRFRARRPVFDNHPLTLCGAPRQGGADLWALDHTGVVAMTAEVDA